MEINNTLNIFIQDNRFCVSPKYRLEKGAYQFMRRRGWKWSPSRDAFVFNVNEEGAKRVKDIIDFKHSPYHEWVFDCTAEEKKLGQEELEEAEIIFDEKAKAVYDKLIASSTSKAQAEEAAKKAKKDSANENRAKRYVNMMQRAKSLKNDFCISPYDASLSNYNMSDLLARKGVVCNYTVKELLGMFNMANLDYDGSDKDVLQFSISYRNVWKGRWSNEIEARRLEVQVDHYTISDGTSFMCGGSGHFAMKINLADEPKIDFKKVVLVSSLIDDQFKEIALKVYMDYRNGLIESPTHDKINGIGMVNLDYVFSPELTYLLKNRFAEAIA